MWLSPALSTLLLLLLAAPHKSNAQEGLKYNEVQMKSSHNSYERRESIMDQLLYHAQRSVEYDCHPAAAAGSFGVYHDAGYFQTYSSLQTLNDGVRTLQEFHEIMPNHHVVTMWVDLKVELGTTHTAKDFDDTIGQLPLWIPSDAAADQSTIKAGIDAYGWPELEELRGKFIWVITSGTDSYCMSDADCVARNAFVAARSAKSAEEVGIVSYKVFYNQASTYDFVGPAIQEAGYIGRIYDLSDIDSQEKWDNAIKNKYQHITTDKINFHRDRFSKSHNAYGYPFLAMNKSVDVSEFKPNEGNMMFMTADNGDAWGRFDDANIAVLVDDTVDEWVEYTAQVSLVNSHCQKFAKAGIMVRQESPDYPIGAGQYFSVMRTCNNFLRVQYREVPYLYTTEKVVNFIASPLDGIENAKRTSLKLRYKYDGNNTIAEGYFKYEGSDVDFFIGSHTFPDIRLEYHGLFASSHYWGGNEDGTDYKVLFVDARRNNETLTTSSFTEKYGGEEFMFDDGWDNPRPTFLPARTLKSLRGESKRE